MDRLRPRGRREREFSGFLNAEVDKMENLITLPREQLLSKEFCQKLMRSFNHSKARAGKPVVKWMQVQSWFQNRLHENALAVGFPLPMPNHNMQLIDITQLPGGRQLTRGRRLTEGELNRRISNMDFEAKSSKDGAWYDVDAFLGHRANSAGVTEAHVRFVGYGADHDEWVNIKESVRLRSIPLEPTECHNVRVGDVMLCFQERKHQAAYYDAIVIDIDRRMHDIRGCRCHFKVRYIHDNTEEKLYLQSICRKPVL